MNEARFVFVWEVIMAAWAAYPHAFERGCGRTTRQSWVKNFGRVTAREVADALEEGVARGWIYRWSDAYGGYRRYGMCPQRLVGAVRTPNPHSPEERLKLWAKMYREAALPTEAQRALHDAWDIYMK